MNKPALAVVFLCLVILSIGCAPMRMVGYDDGWVTSSPVSYQFVGPPLLEGMEGGTYVVNVKGVESSDRVTVASFDKQGMKASAGKRADVTVELDLGRVRQKKPGAMKLGAKWYPAFGVSAAYEISVSKGRSSVAERSGVYANAITFRQLRGFPSREEAVGAIDTIRKLAKSAIEVQTRNGALAEAKRRINEITAGLFKTRNISVEVPVVRSAAGVELEDGYTLLVEAENPEQVRRALATYEQLGTAQRKDDGSPNDTAN